MSIVKAIENMELEVQNNDDLAQATEQRYATLHAGVVALLGQVNVFAEQLQAFGMQIASAQVAARQEFDNRRQALRNIIGDGQ